MTSAALASAPVRPAPLSRRRLLRLGRAVGGLYLLGNVFGIASVRAMAPLEGSGSIGASITAHASAAPAAALAILLMGVALAFIPVVAYPVLAERSAPAARAFVLMRSVVELTAYAASASAVAMLAPLAGEVDDAVLEAVAEHAPLTALIAVGFLGSAVILYATLFRARLVPRWISAWGLAATVPYLVGEGMVLFGAADADAPAVVALLGLLALQEMVLAVWLLWRGFSRPAPAQSSDESPSGRSSVTHSSSTT